jgi:hypothetical protein
VDPNLRIRHRYDAGVETDASLLVPLATADLHALRLAAQVMQHKAQLDDRPHVADYFARLGTASTGELATRGEAFRVVPPVTELGLDPAADAEDHRLLAEYLGLLIGNERLSPSLREISRSLRSRHCR